MKITIIIEYNNITIPNTCDNNHNYIVDPYVSYVFYFFLKYAYNIRILFWSTYFIDSIIQSLYYDIYNHDVDYNLAEPSILKINKISAKPRAGIIKATYFISSRL